MSLCEPWKINISDFYYLNVLRLLSLALLSGYQMDIMDIFDKDTRTGFRRAGSMQAITALIKAKQVLTEMYTTALSVAEAVRSDEAAVGSIVEFEGHFRTRNCPRDLDNFRLTGVIENDPHIYRVYKDLSGYRLVLPYDPIWLTSTTSQVMFSSGSFTCAGLCRVRGVDGAGKKLIASPYFIGVPKPNWDIAALWTHIDQSLRQ